MGLKRSETFRNEESTPMAAVGNVSEKLREARLRWLGYVEENAE